MAKIALDMMGSDYGATNFIKGLKLYLKKDNQTNFVCFGKKEELKELEGLPRVEIVDCSEIVPMETTVLNFLRMKDSSLYRAILSVKEKKCDGIVTCGSTAGFLTGSTLLLKNIEGVTRAGFCSPFPTAIKNKMVCILDIGASNINNANELVGFAKLGSIYAKNILGYDNPSCYLLSNGLEKGKGLQESVEAYNILEKDKNVNFKGNVEARYCLNGNHDVVVTSGYPGNIFLKSTEGTALMMNKMIKQAFTRNIFSKIGYLLAKKGFDNIKETMDYRKSGGAILLGVNGVAIKAHGNSDDQFIFHSISLAKKMIDNNIVNIIKREFN